MLNLLSLLLGLLAWAVGIAAIVQKGRPWGVFVSMGLCGAALAVQFFEIARLVAIEDFSALLDISDTLAKVAAFLLVTTMVLNLAALWRGKGR